MKTDIESGGTRTVILIDMQAGVCIFYFFLRLFFFLSALYFKFCFELLDTNAFNFRFGKDKDYFQIRLALAFAKRSLPTSLKYSFNTRGFQNSVSVKLSRTAVLEKRFFSYKCAFLRI